MATSTSRLSYGDCFEILDKALENKKGIKFQIPDYGAGNHLRVRLHSARKINREDNQVIYQPDHQLYGRSIYDPLVCRMRKEKGIWFMYIERLDIGALDIQPLGEDYVLTETPISDLRAAGGEGEPQSGEEASEAAIDVFDGEAEREAEPPTEAPQESPGGVLARRRI